MTATEDQRSGHGGTKLEEAAVTALALLLLSAETAGASRLGEGRGR